MEDMRENPPVHASSNSPPSDERLESTVEHVQPASMHQETASMHEEAASMHEDIASEKKLAVNRKRWHNLGQTASTYWLFEVLCIILSMACLIAVAVVLHSFDGHPVPTWHYGITLNAIISLLASVATFSLIVPITASLSQFKWLWFRGSRSLTDFEMIEDASRGPVGSILLLLRWRGG